MPPLLLDDDAVLALAPADAVDAMRQALLAAYSGELVTPARVRAELGDGVAAVVGSGLQAWTQLWATTAVRDIKRVQVFSPDPQRRAQFAARTERELGVHAVAVRSAREALVGAEIVILATRASSPVIDADDVQPGAHVVTVGPKGIDAHETPVQLAERASVISCDSPAQAGAYATPFFTGPLPLTDLAAILAGAASGRQGPDDVTLHCSVGLAGTEVLLAQRLFEATRT